jgi:hypothetical protein
MFPGTSGGSWILKSQRLFRFTKKMGDFIQIRNLKTFQTRGIALVQLLLVFRIAWILQGPAMPVEAVMSGRDGLGDTSSMAISGTDWTYLHIRPM